MVTAVRIDVEDVRAELRIEDVINRYGLKVRRHGRTLRAKECPRCRLPSSSEAIVFNPRKDTWGHFGAGKAEGGECFGNAIDLVAVCEGLDTKRDFVKVLEIAAKIAGVEARPLTDDERAARRAYREQQAAERQIQADAEEAAMLREAKLKAASVRQRLLRSRETRTSCRGYLLSRGLDGGRLLEGDHARSDLLGNPHVTLWSLDDSEPINVVHRVIDEKNTGPRVLGLPGCPTAGTLCGRVADITTGSTVVVTEGLIDTLTAIQLWPDHVVLGAHGAGRMALLVETVAPIIVSKGGKLVLVPDGDDVGQRCAIKAGEAAMAAGLEMDNTLIVLDLGAHHDLNAAHCAGWKP